MASWRRRSAIRDATRVSSRSRPATCLRDGRDRDRDHYVPVARIRPRGEDPARPRSSTGGASSATRRAEPAARNVVSASRRAAPRSKEAPLSSAVPDQRSNSCWRRLQAARVEVEARATTPAAARTAGPAAASARDTAPPHLARDGIDPGTARALRQHGVQPARHDVRHASPRAGSPPAGQLRAGASRRRACTSCDEARSSALRRHRPRRARHDYGCQPRLKGDAPTAFNAIACCRRAVRHAHHLVRPSYRPAHASPSRLYGMPQSASASGGALRHLIAPSGVRALPVTRGSASRWPGARPLSFRPGDRADPRGVRRPCSPGRRGP